jgi:hypothetical protein
MDDYNLPAVPARSIRYSCGAQDELINQIGLSVLSEMMSPTAAGRMLVETSSLLLAARLAHAHLGPVRKLLNRLAVSARVEDSLVCWIGLFWPDDRSRSNARAVCRSGAAFG